MFQVKAGRKEGGKRGGSQREGWPGRGFHGQDTRTTFKTPEKGTEGGGGELAVQQRASLNLKKHKRGRKKRKSKFHSVTLKTRRGKSDKTRENQPTKKTYPQITPNWKAEKMKERGYKNSRGTTNKPVSTLKQAETPKKRERGN